MHANRPDAYSIMNSRKTATLLFLGLTGISAHAGNDYTVYHEYANSSPYVAHTDSLSKKNFVHKIIDYFRDSNKQDPNKRFDFGFIPGPHFSSTTGLGLGTLSTITYKSSLSDPLLPRSNASLSTDITTGGFFSVGINGTHIFPQEKYRLDYRVKLSTFTTNFWGIGYDQGRNSSNETEYRRNKVQVMTRFMFKLAPNMYLGPLLNYNFIQARNIHTEFEHLWNNESRILRSYTTGLTFTYDSRDFMLNAKKGTFLQIDQTFTPRFLGNGDYNFSSTEVTCAGYCPIWKGATLAAELHGKFNYGHTPWGLLSEVGTNDRMRGYYEGRYRDLNLIEGQVEIRQHIKKRHGAVAWVALANVFPSFKDIAWRKTLPNAGVGYRWEFKKGINIRIDCGLTKHGSGFIFNINEAF